MGDEYLFRSHDEKGNLLFTPVPNPLMLAMFGMVRYTQNELIVLLFICRYSYGFKKQEVTNKRFDLKDIEQKTGIDKSGLSRAINGLLTKKAIFQFSKQSDKFFYAINLLGLNAEMKHFKQENAGYVLQEKEYVIDPNGELTDSFGDAENAYIYSPKGFKGGANSSAKKTTSVSSETAKVTSVPNEAGAIKNKSITEQMEEREKKTKELLKLFYEDIVKNNSAETFLKHMVKLHDSGCVPAETILGLGSRSKEFTDEQFSQFKDNYYRALTEFKKTHKW